MKSARVAQCGFAIAVLLGCGAEPRDPPGTLTWSDPIAEIVHARCASCHRPGEIAPFSLLTHRQVKRKARTVAEVIESGFMPPWRPAPQAHRFRDDRSLPPRERGRLLQWLAEGAPEGDPASAPSPPAASEGWRLGEPDLVLSMPAVFELPAEGEDVFWNFVIPVPLDRTRYVRGVELRPGNASVVHHAEIRIDTEGRSRRLEAQPGAGFPGTVEGGFAEPPLGHFLGWVPGQTPFVADDGGTWPLRPGADLVLELHMLPSGRPETVQAEIGLYWSDTPPRYQPYLLRLGRRDLDIPAGAARYAMEDRFVLPIGVRARAIQPHAHFLGREVRVEARRPDGERVQLIHIPDWDFAWQDDYRYAEPIPLPAGTEIRAHFVYDNSADNPRNPAQPPRRVRYGPQSRDEMGDVWLQVIPDDPAALPRLRAARVGHDLRHDVVRYEMMRAAQPESAGWRYGLGNALFRLGELDAAAGHYEAAIALDPEHASAHNDLGTTRVGQGRTEDAERLYRRALELDPTSARAHRNMANLALQERRYPEAQAMLERLLDLAPYDARAHNNLGSLLALAGRREEARVHFEAALRVDPDQADARRNLDRLGPPR